MLLTIFIVVALLIDLTVFTQADRYVLSETLFLAQLVAAYLFVPAVHASVLANGLWTTLMEAVPIYLAIGTVVATGKWLLFNVRIATKVKELAATFKPRVAASEEERVPNEYRQFIKYVDGSGHGLYRLLKSNDNGYVESIHNKDDMIHMLTPQAKKYVDRITSWIVQWPIVILALVLEDVILKIGEWVSAVFGDIFTRFAKYLIGKATAGIGG